MRSSGSQPWIASAGLDSLLILAPPFLAVLMAYVFRDGASQSTSTPLILWVILILCIDVAHVYGTLFRTYWNAKNSKRQKQLYFWVPLLAWLCGVLLYSFGAFVFWRTLAYLAVFHFVRQQYGLMRIYSRLEADRWKWLDAGLIYLCTLYPLIYWHTHLPRNFNWFVEGDFVVGLPLIFEPLGLGLYFVFAISYVCKEFLQWKKFHEVSWPKQFVILGTGVSWYLGIVMFNGDIIFTLVNVVSHGIPYLGLVWLLGRKEQERGRCEIQILKWKTKSFFKAVRVPVFIGILILLAYLEEGLWDGLIWRERTRLFALFSNLPAIQDSATLMWLVPLLSLPQSVHYILDGFIWRRRALSSELDSP